MKVQWGTISLLLRPATPTDHGYVYSTWLRSYRQMHIECVPADEWFEGQRRVIRDLMPMVQVAAVAGASTTAHGWICGTKGVVHYAYVPIELRRKGLAKALVEAVAGASGVHTHRKPNLRNLNLRRAFGGFRYDLFALTDAVRAAHSEKQAA